MVLIVLIIKLIPGYDKWLYIGLLLAWVAAWIFIYKRTSHKVWFVTSMLLFLIFFWITINLSFVQNFLVNKATSILSAGLKTKVSIQHVEFSPFNKILMEDVLVEDRLKDTLLYAGNVSVNITDWFFFSDKPVLKYIGLKDATINLKRTDSVWNYQFIADYFTSSKDTTKKSSLQFDLKDVELQNIHFNKTDGWVGKNINVSLKELSLSAEEINFSKKKIVINMLDLDEPSYTEHFYDGKQDTSGFAAKSAAKTVMQDSAKNNTADSWLVNVKTLQLKNGTFGSETLGTDVSPDGLFDGDHIYFSSITGTLKNVQLQKDTLTTDLSLYAKERCGLEVKKIQASLKFSSQLMEFNNLDLILNKSRLRNYYAMHFHHFSQDMGNFLHSVKLDATFNNSEVSSDDIAFFTPALKTWKRSFKMNGVFKGSVDNFTAKHTLIKSGNSFVSGDLDLVGLPDINNTFIDLKSNAFQSNYPDIVSIIPSLKNIRVPQLSKLSSIQFKGNFTGFIKDFVAYGTITTNLGAITSDINLKLPGDKPSVYIGNISSNGFQLGQFINNSNLGNIVFNGKVNGTGFTADDVKTNFDGTISRLAFDGYEYQNISVKGDFERKLFSGSVSINDPNLKLDTLNGTIDLNGKEPQFDFDALLTKANLKQLKLTDSDYVLSGHFNLNFTGNNIDNFIGTALVNNASVLHDGNTLPFDSLVLKSAIVDNEKELTLQSNEIEAAINGKFKILSLPAAFSSFLNHYYPSYIKKPTYHIDDQDFRFQITTKNFDEYVELMNKKLKGFNNTTISGSLQSEKNNLAITANVPGFSYDEKTFDNIRLESTGNLDTLETTINTDDIMINDSLHLPATKLVIKSHNDISEISIKTSASKSLSDASLNAQVQTLSDGVKIHFFSSSFIINDKEWDLEKDGVLELRNSSVIANNVKFDQGNSQIQISTAPSSKSDTNNNDIIIGLNKVSIDDITPFVLTSPRLEGMLTGNLKISNAFKKPDFNYEVKANEFRLDGDSIGTLTTKGNYSSESGLATFNVQSDDTASKLNITGTVNVNDTSTNQVNIAFITEKLNLNILNNYLSSVFSDIKGSANTTDLRVSGNGKHLLVTGTAFINDGSLRVNYTQCKYTFNNATIIFNPDEIDLGTIKIKDSLHNSGTVTGKLYHDFFQDFEFDNVSFETNKLLVLNTTKKDNNQFYGKVIGNATMVLDGPVTNMNMSINGEPSATDSSHIYLLSGNSIETGSIDYIDFKQFGSKMEDDFGNAKSSNIFVNMNLSANPACKIDVVLDESTGDVIKGEGNCNNLNIQVGTTEPLTIRGKYYITKGEYTFNFQKFLKKKFLLTNGNIVWTGDPFIAAIDITAEYPATNVDFSVLTGTSGTTSTTSSVSNIAKSDLTVVAHLTNTLDKPKIDFVLRPENSEVKNDVVISKRLQEFQNDENEMNKQVTSILLFNSFINSSQSFLNASSGYSVLSGTIGGVISSTVSGFFNNLLQRYIKNTSFYFNSNSSIANSEIATNAAKLQGAVTSGLVFNLANGRLIISAGVNLDYNDPYIISATNNLFVTPDFTAEWLLTKDGEVRVVGFNKTSVDINGQRNTSGLKLSYRKDFDKLSEFFIPAEEKKKKKETVSADPAPGS